MGIKRESIRGSTFVPFANAMSVWRTASGGSDYRKKPDMDHSEALRQFPYGLYLLGASRNGHPLVILANWVMQVSFSPPIVVAAIEVESKMHQYITDSGFFSVNVLPAGNVDLPRAFLKSQEPNGGLINGHPYRAGRHGSPLIEDASSVLECRVVAAHEAGDHTLFIGHVVQSSVKSRTSGITLKESGLSYHKKSI
jgi:flavin reductase (DIM6/NTAB) family NADH-FMN oxidoreductase RutF